jgi:hypothetical protein
MTPLVVFAVVVVIFMLLFVCLTTQKSLVKSLLLLVAMLHVVASLTIPVLMQFAVGFGKLNIVDTYVELDQRGVIDHAKLREVRGGRFAENWALPDNLGDHFDAAEYIAIGVSAFCFASGIGLLAIWWRLRKQDFARDGSDVVA